MSITLNFVSTDEFARACQLAQQTMARRGHKSPILVVIPGLVQAIKSGKAVRLQYDDGKGGGWKGSYKDAKGVVAALDRVLENLGEVTAYQVFIQPGELGKESIFVGPKPNKD